MKHEIDVVTALIRQPNTRNYLIALRPEEDSNGGVWEFPGGKVEENDKTLVDALKRELSEELLVKVSQTSYAPIRTLKFETEERTINIHFFLVQLKRNSNPFPVEHVDIDYMDVFKLSSIQNFSEVQKPIITLLQQNHI